LGAPATSRHSITGRRQKKSYIIQKGVGKSAMGSGWDEPLTAANVVMLLILVFLLVPRLCLETAQLHPKIGSGDSPRKFIEHKLWNYLVKHVFVANVVNKQSLEIRKN
jgi:hypothetical protein